LNRKQYFLKNVQGLKFFLCNPQYNALLGKIPNKGSHTGFSVEVFLVLEKFTRTDVTYFFCFCVQVVHLFFFKKDHLHIDHS